MSENRDKDQISKGGPGFFQDISLRIKLILRLMSDRRVNPLLKLLPIGSLLYWIIPDLVFGPFDDAAVIWLGGYLFVELCPSHIVQEHLDDLTSVIDGQFRELDENDRSSE
jgi:hypothetical protein